MKHGSSVLEHCSLKRESGYELSLLLFPSLSRSLRATSTPIAIDNYRNMRLNGLRVIIAACLNDPHRSQVGVGMTTPARRRRVVQWTGYLAIKCIALPF